MQTNPSDYIRLKQEASGFPDGCDTPKQHQDYIQDILRREGIFMNSADIQKLKHTLFLAIGISPPLN